MKHVDKYYQIIVERSNLDFYDFHLNQLSTDASYHVLSDMYHFAKSVENLLSNNTHASYTMVVFDIDGFGKINDLYGHRMGDELLCHINKTLKSLIQNPNLYCRVYDDNFALFLENYKKIDIALLVIQLTEEISNYNPQLAAKLSFGICNAGKEGLDIPSLCSRAYYAKSTIKGIDYQLLANYDELPEIL